MLALSLSGWAAANPAPADLGEAFRLDTAETVAPASAALPPPLPVHKTAVSATLATPAGERLAREVVRSADARGWPFVVVDKPRAEILVYGADGRLVGRSPALLGSARGDDSVPGVGERTQRGELRPQDRTTPAGRFVARVGRNFTGEKVLWVDWNAAFAVHRLREGPSLADRQHRLRQPAAQRRVSDGCVVVPGAFFDEVLLRTLAGGRSMVYVLPERAGVVTLEALNAWDAQAL